jgi:flavin reductase (DIM6/NTAB) family NADH-FMN oxidoreductase RutF/rubredoxin
MNKKTLHKISYGLYIVSSKKDEKFNGQIANSLFQVTSNPTTIAFSINKQNLTHDYIIHSGLFTISILSQDADMPFIGKFGFKSGRDIDKFENIKYEIGDNQVPIVIDNAVGYIEGKIINQVDGGTHTIFIGEVTNAEMLSNENVMTYEFYHKVKGGISPKSAPTYSAEVDKVEIKKGLPKYKCTVCGYVYDPIKGDEDSGIKPNAKFEDLPETWVCPVCGADKAVFELI